MANLFCKKQENNARKLRHKYIFFSSVDNMNSLKCRNGSHSKITLLSTTLGFLLTAPSMPSAHTERKQPQVLFITKIIAAALQVHFTTQSRNFCCREASISSVDDLGSEPVNSQTATHHLSFIKTKLKHCVC